MIHVLNLVLDDTAAWESNLVRILNLVGSYLYPAKYYPGTKKTPAAGL